MQIAVAGGTGLIGKMVVDAVRASGDTPVVLARSTGVDLTTGAGVDEALVNVSAVIDVSNIATTNKSKAVAFFQAATTNLLAAEERAGITHHVALSIVGVDRVGWGYYFGKRRQEELALSGRIPATVLRATQFHEFAAQMLARGGPFAIAPNMLTQPVAEREVAAALVEISRDTPLGQAPELAGPRQLQMADMVRQLRTARGGHRLVVPLRLPGAAGKAMANGALLPSGDGPRSAQTFTQWLSTPDASTTTPDSGRA